MTAGDVTPVPQVVRAHHGEAAGVVSRLIATVVDVVVVAGLMLASYGAWVAVRFFLAPRSFKLPDGSLLWSLTAASVATAVYFCVAWTLTGRTYGDHMMGLRVVDRHGRHLPLGASALRALLAVAFPVGLLWAAVDSRRRSIQDLVVRSRVTHDWH